MIGEKLIYLEINKFSWSQKTRMALGESYSIDSVWAISEGKRPRNMMQLDFMGWAVS